MRNESNFFLLPISEVFYFNVLIYVTESGHILISRCCCHSALMAVRQKLMHFKISNFFQCAAEVDDRTGRGATELCLSCCQEIKF